MSSRGRPRKVRYNLVCRSGGDILTYYVDLADKKRVETGKGDESDDSDRPKKKAPAKGKTNGKSKGRA